MSAVDAAARLEREYPGSVRYGESMARHTTFRIGGPADALFFAPDAGAVARAVQICAEAGEPYFAMGNGSNLLVSDKGMRELVIAVRAGVDGVEVRGRNVVAGAGARLSAVAEMAADAGLSGLEFSFGIPGCLGGALTMNAGAYCGEMRQVVRSVTVVEKDGHMRELSADELDFGYRTSAIAGGRIALSATLALKYGDRAAVRAAMDDLLERRRQKQPLEWPSAGSVFKRPPGHFAGGLIEAAHMKGARVGGAQVSEKHAGFIVNLGGATCADVLELIARIQERVMETSGVMLETELRPVGER